MPERSISPTRIFVWILGVIIYDLESSLMWVIQTKRDSMHMLLDHPYITSAKGLAALWTHITLWVASENDHFCCRLILYLWWKSARWVRKSPIIWWRNRRIVAKFTQNSPTQNSQRKLHCCILTPFRTREVYD